MYFIDFHVTGSQDETVNYGELAIRTADEEETADTFVKSLDLDIYGQSRRDIDTCIPMIDLGLNTASMTVHWSTKPSYEEDKDLIFQLAKDKDTVSLI